MTFDSFLSWYKSSLHGAFYSVQTAHKLGSYNQFRQAGTKSLLSWYIYCASNYKRLCLTKMAHSEIPGKWDIGYCIFPSSIIAITVPLSCELKHKKVLAYCRPEKAKLVAKLVNGCQRQSMGQKVLSLPLPWPRFLSDNSWFQSTTCIKMAIQQKNKVECW